MRMIFDRPDNVRLIERVPLCQVVSRSFVNLRISILILCVLCQPCDGVSFPERQAGERHASQPMVECDEGLSIGDMKGPQDDAGPPVCLASDQSRGAVKQICLNSNLASAETPVPVRTRRHRWLCIERC